MDAPLGRSLIFTWNRKYIYYIYYNFSEECSDKGGTSGGSCAEGYGVCCQCK